MLRGWRTAIAAGLIALSTGCGRNLGEPQADQATPVSVAKPTGPQARSAGPILSRRPSRIEARLVPPDSAIGSDPDSQSPSIVFLSPRPLVGVLEWVRARADSEDFVLDAEMEEGAEHVFNGRMRERDQAFTVRLARGANGGTTGVVLVTPRR